MEAKPKVRKVAWVVLGVVGVLVPVVIWSCWPILVSSVYEDHRVIVLRRDGDTFGHVNEDPDPNGINVSGFSGLSQVRFSGGLIVNVSTFNGADELVVVVQSKKWAWLPIPEHRSFFGTDEDRK